MAEPTAPQTIMHSNRYCEVCGSALGEDGPQGLCPKCLLRQGLTAVHTPGCIEAPDCPAAPDAQAGPEPSVRPQLSSTIGPYKLLQEIGEGGFGVVYMAEQEAPVRRRVALKVIKEGMDTRQVIARFEAERQALALMDHPNIAKVLDAGSTEAGRPYFVMELVPGLKITEFCDRHRLPPEERLKLFQEVCKAVQHAHQKGIIHRDLKPSNILVTLHDGVPVPKIIDFGIAKATGFRLTNKTLFTAFAQMIGTPAYMSPEQAELSGIDIDTRSDIYSLGVLLYELLTGRPPFETEDLLRAGLDEMRRIIRETEPAKPSTRLGALGKAELSSTAEARRSEPPKLMSLIRGDLDWIVMKCLEKDRNRRYETANGLAIDIQRYLSQEPVSAAAPSKWYRYCKFARRNRVSLTAAAALALVLVAATTVSLWQAVQATRAKALAQTEATKNERVTAFLQEVFESVKPSVALGRDTTLLREILDRAVARLGTELRDQPEIATELRRLLAVVYSDLGAYRKAEALLRTSLADQQRSPYDPGVLVVGTLCALGAVLLQDGRHAEAEEFIEQALVLREKLSTEDKRKLAGSIGLLCMLRLEQGRLDEAEALARELLAQHTQVGGNQESMAMAEALEKMAIVLRARANFAEAEALFRKVWGICAKLHAGDHPDKAHALGNLAAILGAQDRLSEAGSLAFQALEMERKLLGEHEDVALSLNNLAAIRQREGNFVEAESRLREALALQKKLQGPENPKMAMTLENLALVLQARGKLAEAEPLAREALAMGKKLAVDNHPDVASSLEILASIRQELGDLAEAETLSREALGIRQKTFGRDHPDVATSLCRLGTILGKKAASDEAEGLLREGLSMHERVHSPSSRIAAALTDLGSFLQQQGRAAEAEELVRRALSRREKLLGDQHPEVARLLNSLAQICRSLRKLNEAEALAREALTRRQKLFGREHREVASSLNTLGTILGEQGNLLEAEKVAREALAVQRKLVEEEHPDVAGMLSNLAMILTLQGKIAEAEPLVREALTIRKKMLGNEHGDVAQTLHTLAELIRGQGRLAEAEPLARDSVALHKKLVGEQNPDLAGPLNTLGAILAGLDKLQEAESLFREAVAIAKGQLTPDHPLLARIVQNLLRAVQVQGKIAEAEVLMSELVYSEFALEETIKSGRLSEALRVLGAQIEKTPQRRDLRLATAALYGRQGQCGPAAADLSWAIRISEEPDIAAFPLGPLLVMNGDSSEYKNFCRRLIGRFTFTEDPRTAAETALSLLLEPFELGLSPANRLAELAASQGMNDAALPYYRMIKGLAEYRQGRSEEACDSTRASLAGDATAATAVAATAVLAMAQRQLGRTEDARKTLSEVVQLAQNRLPRLDSGDLGEDWPVRLVAHILLREAQTTPPVPAPRFIKRSEQAPPECIDLTRHYNAWLWDGWHFDGGHGPSLRDFPADLPRFGGVLFDVRGLIQLSGKRSAIRFPARVEGIEVNQNARQIHFLHATGWMVPDGTTVANYVVNYVDNVRQEILIRYGAHLREWHGRSDPTSAISAGTLAWETDVGKRRLYESTWVNPRPGVKIETLDLISAETDCFPFLVAITVEL